jgi:hypothetical protein
MSVQRCTHLPMSAFSHFDLKTLIALTTIVSIPKGPMAAIILLAYPNDRLKNCFVAWSPKSAKSGARGSAVVVVVAILISAFES